MVIATAEMSDLQHRIVRLRRPIQQHAMRVPDYYKRFCDWKEEMICVGHPDDEASYIDDFIGNLQWHLRLRVSKRQSSMSRLVDAFNAAKFDESMILIEEVIKDIRAETVFDEMPSRLPTNSQRGSVVPDNGGVHIIDTLSMAGDISHESILENQVCNVFNEMADVERQPHPLKIDSLKDVLHVFDEMPRPFLVEQNDKNSGNVDKGGDTTVNGSCRGSTKAWVGEETSIMEGVLGKNVMAVDAYQDKLSLVDPNEESYANEDSITSIDCVPLVFDQANGLTYEEVKGLCTQLSMNNNVPPSLAYVTMVYYRSIVEVACQLFDPGGCYLLQLFEWCSNEACTLIDLLSWVQRALDSDDVESVRIEFRNVLNTIQPGVMPKLIDVSSDSVINPDIITLPTHQDFRTFGNFYMAADEIGLLTCEAYDIEFVGNELCKPNTLCGKYYVRKIFNQFMLYMSWLSLIVVKTGDKLATKMFMLNGVEWNLQIEQGWSAWQEALCAKDEVQLVATTKDMSFVSPGITTLHCLAETFGQLKILKSFPKLWMEMKEEGNLLWVLNQDFLGQKSSIKPDKDVKKIYQPCPQFIDNLSDKKGEPTTLISELRHPSDNNRIHWINIVHERKKVKPLQQVSGWMLGACFVMLEGMVSWAKTVDEKGDSEKWLQEFKQEVSFVLEGATGLMTNSVPHKMESTSCLIIVSVKKIIWSSGLYVCYFLILDDKDACEREEVIEDVQNVYINMELCELLNGFVPRGRRCVDPTARSILNIQMLNVVVCVIFWRKLN